MKNLNVGLIYVAFYSAIGIACYITQSGWPLLAMIFTPSWESKSDDKKKKKDN